MVLCHDINLKSKTKPNGFSALEMLTVIAIIGILAAMAVPTVKIQTTKGKLKEDALDVREVLTKARSLAQSRQECVLVKLDPPKKLTVTSHKPLVGKNCSAGLDAETYKLAPVLITGPGTISSFNESKTEVIFNTHGGLAETGLMVVRVYDDKDEFQIVVYPAIGQIRMR